MLLLFIITYRFEWYMKDTNLNDMHISFSFSEH